ncbi:MAG TPA: hypothetical protein VF736_23625 [Pyrinomonadaceae bacterium]|jgi:hypothetical protein
MPVKESSATALVRFTGLGIICFNEERGRGEIAAIRDDKHSLSITIGRPVFQDGSGKDTVAYQEMVAYRNLPKHGVEVEIKGLGRRAVEGFEIYRHEDFDRLGNADVNDFQWVLNLNNLHAGAAVRPTAQGRDPLTKIYISDGLFYTHSLDTEMFFEKVEKDADGRETRREVFGNVGETIGVKIEADEVSFTIRAGGMEETHSLKRVEGLPFVIEFKNMDYSDDAVYSDMADYYGYLSSPDGRQFDLDRVVEDEGGRVAGGGSVNQEEFCHPIAADLSSIDEL